MFSWYYLSCFQQVFARKMTPNPAIHLSLRGRTDSKSEGILLWKLGTLNSIKDLSWSSRDVKNKNQATLYRIRISVFFLLFIKKKRKKK